jgi:hypothetical protein
MLLLYAFFSVPLLFLSSVRMFCSACLVTHPRCMFIPLRMREQVLQPLLVTVTGWHRKKRPFYGVLCVPIWVIIIPDSSTIIVWLQQRHLVAKQGGAWGEIPVNFSDEVSLSTPQGFLICHKILTTWGRRLYFPSEGSAADICRS